MTTLDQSFNSLQNAAARAVTAAREVKDDVKLVGKDIQSVVDERIISPGKRWVEGAADRAGQQWKNSSEQFQQQFQRTRETLSDHPGKVLLAAIAGGIFLGLLARKK